jgi:hypothetical protein
MNFITKINIDFQYKVFMVIMIIFKI